MTHTEESLMALANDCVHDFIGMDELQTAIREVLAERDHAKQAWDAAIEHANHMTGELEKAEAECERLRKDAERYRWIEKQIDIYGAEWAPATVANAIVRSDGARLDAAIDAAIKDQP